MTAVTALGAPQGDTVVAQVADLARDDTVYRWGFFFASLLPAAMVPFMAVVALGVAAPGGGRGDHGGAALRLGRHRAGGGVCAALGGRVRVAVHRLRLAAAA